MPEGPQWRFVMTDLDTVTLSFLERLASNRSIDYTLNKPVMCKGRVPSDNPEVNIEHTDGFPFLSANNRLMFGFRREETPTDWVCRQSGIIHQVEDKVETDQPYSYYTAYDPWQYLYSQPVVLDDLTLPGANGMNALPAETGNSFALRLLDNVYAYNVAAGYPHPECYIDRVSGTFDTTAVIYPFNVQAGTMIGEAFDQLVATGTLDIVFTPIYDPLVRPGIISELNIYDSAGVSSGESLVWDSAPYSLVGVNRLHDGTQQANIVQYYAGQGGPKVTIQTDAGSISDYGPYWTQQFFPVQGQKAGVVKFAQAQLAARAEPGLSGVTTYTALPTPQIAPMPFTDYYLGDTISVTASDALRQAISATLRIYSIPIEISDDALERVSNLLFTDS